jgi:hypothetical protein
MSACFSNLKMVALHCTKTLVNFYQPTWHHIPEGGTLSVLGCTKDAMKPGQFLIGNHQSMC